MKTLNRDILCISNLDWDSSWQRHQEFMTFFSKVDFRIFYLNNSGFTSPQLRNFKSIARKLILRSELFKNPKPKNLTVIQPKVIPPRVLFNRTLNQQIFFPILFKSIQQSGIGNRPILYIYLPSRLSLAAIDFFMPSKIVYDYVSDFEAHLRKPGDFTEIHQALLNKCDLLLTDSSNLAEKLANSPRKPFILHHGVSDEFFLPQVPKSEKGYRACYFGTIDSKVLDIALLNELVSKGHSIELIGPIKGDLSGLDPAIRYTSQMRLGDLARSLQDFDILLLPYLNTGFNATVTPAKIYQCLATGKPILVHGLPALQSLATQGLLSYASSREEFIQIFEKTASESNYESYSRRQEYARCFSSKECGKVLIEQIENLFKS